MIGEAPSQAEHVISKLGGVNSAARLLGHKNASTVQGWKQRGYVPANRQCEVLGKAIAAGVEMSPLDFVIHLLRIAPAPIENLGDQPPQM